MRLCAMMMTLGMTVLGCEQVSPQVKAELRNLTGEVGISQSARKIARYEIFKELMEKAQEAQDFDTMRSQMEDALRVLETQSVAPSP